MCYKALNQYEDALSYLQIVHQADNSNELYIKEIKEKLLKNNNYNIRRITNRYLTI